MADPRYPFSAESVRSGVCLLHAACRAEGVGLRILPGADVRLQPETLDDLDAGRLLTLGDGNRYLLLELSPQLLHPLDGFLFQLRARGVTAVLTHPERHPSLSGDLPRLRRLVEGGCLVQITGASLLGEFGPQARRSAERMLGQGLVHVVASDTHGPDGPRRPRFGPVADRLVKLAGEAIARELLCARPLALLATCRPASATEHRATERTAI
jgi:protein-tyrosine phosphatase